MHNIEDYTLGNTSVTQKKDVAPRSEGLTRDHPSYHFLLIELDYEQLSSETKERLREKIPYFERDFRIIHLIDNLNGEKETLHKIIKPHLNKLQGHYKTEQLDWFNQKAFCHSHQLREPQENFFDRHPEFIKSESAEFRIWWALTHSFDFDINIENSEQKKCLRYFEDLLENSIPGYKLKPARIHLNY